MVCRKASRPYGKMLSTWMLFRRESATRGATRARPDGGGDPPLYHRMDGTETGAVVVAATPRGQPTIVARGHAAGTVTTAVDHHGSRSGAAVTVTEGPMTARMIVDDRRQGQLREVNQGRGMGNKHRTGTTRAVSATANT